MLDRLSFGFWEESHGRGDGVGWGGGARHAGVGSDPNEVVRTTVAEFIQPACGRFQ